MADEDKPMILTRHDLLSPQERKEEIKMIEAQAEKEGRSMSEVLRVAMVRMKFVEIGKGEFYDEMLVESRQKGEAYMDFIKRMNRTYRTH